MASRTNYVRYQPGTRGADQDALQQALGGRGEREDVYDPQPDVNTTMPVGDPAPMVPPVQESAPAGPVNTRETRDALGGYAGVGTMSGFNTSDYGGDTKGRNSVKNTFGRIASRYQAAPGSLDAIFADADFQRYFPNAQRVPGGAGDQIDFGGVLSDFESGVPVGRVDVGQSFDPSNNGGAGWQWIDLVNDQGGPQAGGGQQLSPDLMAALDGLGGSSTLNEIREELDAVINGRPSPTNQRYLQQALTGGA